METAERSHAPRRPYDWLPVEVVYGDAPAAGANFSLTTPGRAGWKLLSLTFKLVTDANAANRSVTVDADDGNGKLFASNGMQGVVLASTTALFSFQANRGTSEANVNNQLFVPLLPVIFEGGQKLQINVLNKQAGDQLSNIVAMFERQPFAPS